MRVGRAGYVTRSNRDDGAGFQLDRLMALQASSADFGALQILQDADGAVFLFGSAAQAIDVAGVIFVRAMRKIQARNIHAQPKQVTHRRL